MRGNEGTNARVHPDRLVRVDTMMRGFLHATITHNLRSFETHNWAGVDAPSLGVSLLGSELGVDRVQSRLSARQGRREASGRRTVGEAGDGTSGQARRSERLSPQDGPQGQTERRHDVDARDLSSGDWG